MDVLHPGINGGGTASPFPRPVTVAVACRTKEKLEYEGTFAHRLILGLDRREPGTHRFSRRFGDRAGLTIVERW